MTRRFLDNIRADLTAQLVAGNQTTADQLRPLMLDMIDSTIQDECGIKSNASTPSLATTTTYVPITTAYGVNEGGDGSFLIPESANGTITTSATAGFTYVINGTVGFTDVGGTVRIDFTILQNGVEIGSPSLNTGEGSGDPVNANVRAYVNSAGANDVFTIGVKTPDGVDTVDILSIGLAATIQPTNNA